MGTSVLVLVLVMPVVLSCTLCSRRESRVAILHYARPSGLDLVSACSSQAFVVCKHRVLHWHCGRGIHVCLVCVCVSVYLSLCAFVYIHAAVDVMYLMHRPSHGKPSLPAANRSRPADSGNQPNTTTFLADGAAVVVFEDRGGDASILDLDWIWIVCGRLILTWCKLVCTQTSSPCCVSPSSSLDAFRRRFFPRSVWLQSAEVGGGDDS